MEYKINLTEEQKNLINKIITKIPKNEYQLIRYFCKIEEILGFNDVNLFIEFPDASAIYNGMELDIEFELYSSNFRRHKHKEELCSLIICWENDHDDFQIPVLELATIANDWKKEKADAIMEYWQIVMMGSSFNKEQRKLSEEDQYRILNLMDKYDFDHDDVVAQYMGLEKASLKLYKSDIELPECLGGPLTCEKRDLDVKYIENTPDYLMKIPVVLCKNCENKQKCKFGMNTEIGYYFILELDENKPLKTRFINKEIKDYSLLKYLEYTDINLWKDVLFHRR